MRTELDVFLSRHASSTHAQMSTMLSMFKSTFGFHPPCLEYDAKASATIVGGKRNFNIAQMLLELEFNVKRHSIAVKKRILVHAWQFAYSDR